MNEVKNPKKPLIFYYIIVLVALMLFNMLAMPWLAEHSIKAVDYNTFVTMVQEGKVAQAEIQEQDNRILFTGSDGRTVYKTAMVPDSDLLQRLLDAGVSTSGVEIEQTSLLVNILSWVLPLVLFIAIGNFVSRKMVEKMGGGNSMMFNMGKSNAKVYVKSSEGNHYLMTKEEMENKIATLTGGRAAEEVVFQSITTGASNDIEQATKLARAMITQYGMSEEFGMVALETVNNQYLGGDASLACSAEMQAKIDDRVITLVKQQHEKATKILEDNRQKLDELAKFLYEKETITGEEFMGILNK